MKYLGKVEHLSNAVLIKNNCGHIPINGTRVYNKACKCFGKVIDSLGNDFQSFQLVEITDGSILLKYEEDVFVHSNSIFVQSLKDINNAEGEINKS